ncbi:NADH-cytochrome b5 reductase-like [Tribolium castaneum]|uniref:NADH-cytochrome b5 reductase n=1 Tax=Tribolium castaneum TaxID=7070 RepID=D2A5H5_TRICA|nr:PREDICTED: NADH-cytochrome b5 reductase-like [Tribolium castaneum]EFA05074.1 NADH-cytochrome b5 reductase-like [Tribolium castaneum]|eukprot:XP_001808476.1 PREDICTED: NADH-cytochrome b5 reductase-like [Tribolium castaneum]
MEPPDEADCCNSGCNPCILDVYEAQLRKYQKLGREKSGAVNALNPTSYTVFVLTGRKKINESVFFYTFKYADCRERQPNCLDYKPGQYFLLRGRDPQGEFTRAYTPIPVPQNASLEFTVLVRLYDTGRMSQLFKTMQVGGETSWRGPYGEFAPDYAHKFLVFIAQGTGIAPLYALIRDIVVHNEECESFVKLFFCVRNCDDILLRDELYELGSFWNFNYEVFCNNCDQNVAKYHETIHNKKMSFCDLENYVQGKLGQVQVMISGSETFGREIKEIIDRLGIESSHVYVF